MTSAPHFRFEKAAISKGHIVCGIDEAGRGPLAGPVVAAAVILDPKNTPKGLNDSKQLNETKRMVLFKEIIASSQFGIGIVDSERIDMINILQATFEAMGLAVAKLKTPPTLALVDGNRPPPLPCEVNTIIQGDAISRSIAAASIIAKVTRDQIMIAFDAEFPHYGFASNKGYGTVQHLFALDAYGPCILHRRSFQPVSQLTMFGQFDSRGVNEDS